MPLISLRCPNCGASIEFSEDAKIGYCMHCGNKVAIMEDARKVEIEYGSTVDNWRKLCVDAFNHGDYIEAKEYANRILEVNFEDQIAREVKEAIRQGRDSLEPYSKEEAQSQENMPTIDEDSFIIRVKHSVFTGKLIDYRNENYDKSLVMEAFKMLSTMDSLEIGKQLVAQFANSCALLSMVICNEPDPFLVHNMVDVVISTKKMLIDITLKNQIEDVNWVSDQTFMAYNRNIETLKIKIRRCRAARNIASSNIAKEHLEGNPQWMNVAQRAADALMDITPPESRWRTGFNSMSNGIKTFEEYAKILDG